MADTRRVAPALAALLLLAGPVSAQPLAAEDVPPGLRPWVDWVLETVPEHACPQVQGERACVWPGRLTLDLGDEGGTFVFEARADRALDLRLPGDSRRWPTDVRLDGKAAPVVEREGAPAVRLPAGAHRVEGRFAWKRLPDSLPVPASVGLVDLELQGRAVEVPRRDQAGLLWLREEGGTAAGAGESLRLQVFRKVQDGIPPFVETHLALEVSGRAREIDLPGTLLPGSAAVSVRGDLPARLDGDDRLRVQVRAGRFHVSVLGRLDGDARALRPPEAADADGTGRWPEREVWVFEARESLRQVELSGAPAIDPSRTDLPEGWRRFPAFVLDPRTALALKEVRRGEPEPAPDAVSLQREMWLDVDGRAFTVRDTFGGALRRTWRLDLLPPAEPGRIAVDSQDQLVTSHPVSKTPGVELRRSALALVAESRLTRGGALPAVGWAVDVEQLRATLHLPPGWRLWAAAGVDKATGAWTERWTLLGFFFVLIVAAAASRLFGRGVGALALLAVVLSYDEPGAPFMLWLSLLAATALMRARLRGWLGSAARIWWLASVGVLVLVLVFFFRDQLRDAVYPHVSAPPALAGGGVFDVARKPPAAQETNAPLAPPPMEPPVEGAVPAAAPVQTVQDEESKVDVLQRRGSAPKRKDKYATYNVALEQDPHAVMQTGPGVPSWSWRSHALSWSGPVSQSHRMRLFLLSPLASFVLALVRLTLVALLAAVVVRRRDGARPGPAAVPEATPPVVPDQPEAEAPPVAPLGLILALLLAGPASAQDRQPAGDEAGSPSPALLEELRQRLTRPEPCQPRCLDTSSVELRIAGQTLTFAAEVHAQAASSWPVPGPTGSWAPAEVKVDGSPTPALVRRPDGFLHVRLSPGVHRVEASGPVPSQDSLTIQFASRPHRASASAPGWEVTGIREDGPPDESIQVTRSLGSAPGTAGEGTYAPWLEVTRTLSVGVSWRVTTEVRRVSPPGVPVAVRVPLLPGESVTEADVEAENGEVPVSLSRDEMETSWSSNLEPRADLALSAPTGRPWSEVWRLQCGVVWQCKAEGLAPVSRQRDGVLEPEYRPWPGESVRLTFLHPQGVPGQTVTLDGVTLETAPGQRLEKGTLTVQTRSSREEALTLTLPEGAEVQELKVGGAVRPARPDGGKLRFAVPAGQQAVVLTWHLPRGMSSLFRVPRVGLPGPAVNAHVRLSLPESRWLLLTFGPGWGPSVLFWPYLLVVVLLALVLSRIPGTPLRAAGWVLLGLGLTQVPAPAAIAVAGFLFALSWRGMTPPRSPLFHDLLQLLLAVWALVAAGCLYAAIEHGLLLRPDMAVAGNGSTGSELRWFADRVAEATPAAGVVSVPIWVYRAAMLAWALWLASGLVRGIGWGWRSANENGLWRPLLTRRPPAAVPPVEPPAVPPPATPAVPPEGEPPTGSP